MDFRHSLALLIGATALAASGLAVLEMGWGSRSEHASMRSTRLAAVALGQVTRQTLDLGLNWRVLAGQETDRDVALVRGQKARARGSKVAAALARADLRAAKLLGRANRAVFVLPPGERGADAEVAEVDRVVADANEALDAVEKEAELADTYGRRQTRAVFGLTLAATAGALFGLAGVIGSGRNGRIVVAAGALLLVGALSAGILSFA